MSRNFVRIFFGGLGLSFVAPAFASGNEFVYSTFIIFFLIIAVLWLTVFAYHLRNQQYQTDWIKSSSLPCIAIDVQGKVIDSNIRSEEMLDITVRRLKGEMLNDLIEPYDVEVISPVSITFDSLLTHPEQLYRSRKYPDSIFRLDRGFFCANFHCFHIIDESERVRFIESNQLAQQLSTKSKLIASAMHEIGSPLVAIEGGLEYLLVLLSEPDESSAPAMLDITSKMLNEARRVNNIKIEFTGLFRDGMGAIDLHDLNALVRRACNLMGYDKRMINISVDFELDTNISAVRFNEGKLLQVILNLLANSADALVECYWRSDKKIKIITRKVDSFIRMSIEDNGIGMSVDILEKSADIYFTTKNSELPNSGSGLGLVICKDLIQQMGGKMLIESKLDQGTAVHLDFIMAED